MAMIEKWYRGHSGKQQATDNFGIIWLADDPEYAQLYADEYPNGVVSTIFVDMDKINYLDWYYDEDFDPYDPDMSLLKNYMKEQGCNAYTFPLNDGITVLALLTTEPIVKIKKTIIENKKYRNMKIRLTESKLKQIVAESVKKVLKEGSYDKNGNFDAESHNSDLRDKFVSVVETLIQSMEYAINELSYIETSTTNENISNKARIIINDLLNRGTLAKQVYSSVKAGRLDI